MTQNRYSRTYTERDLELIRLRKQNELLEHGGKVRIASGAWTAVRDRRNWVVSLAALLFLGFYATGHINSLWYIIIGCVFGIIMYLFGRTKEVLIGVLVAFPLVTFLAFEVFEPLYRSKALEIDTFNTVTWAFAFGMFITAVAYCLGWSLIVLGLTGSWTGQRKRFLGVPYPNHQLIPTATEDVDAHRRRVGMVLTFAVPMALWSLICGALISGNKFTHDGYGEDYLIASGVIVLFGVILLLLGIHLDRAGQVPSHVRFVERSKIDSPSQDWRRHSGDTSAEDEDVEYGSGDEDND